MVDDPVTSRLSPPRHLALGRPPDLLLASIGVLSWFFLGAWSMYVLHWALLRDHLDTWPRALEKYIHSLPLSYTQHARPKTLFPGRCPSSLRHPLWPAIPFVSYIIPLQVSLPPGFASLLSPSWMVTRTAEYTSPPYRQPHRLPSH